MADDTAFDDASDAKISQLPDGGLPTQGDKIPMARGGQNYNIDGGQIANSATFVQAFTDLNSASSVGAAAVSLATQASAFGPRLDGAYAQANAAYGLAQQAYAGANSATSLAATANTAALTAWGQANTALAQAQTAQGHAAQAWATANAALAQGNPGAALALAQAAYDRANSAVLSASTAQTTGQSAYGTANGAVATAQTATGTAGAAMTTAQPAYDQANAAYALAQSAYVKSTQDNGYVASGLAGMASLSNYIVNQIDFNELCTAPNTGSNTDVVFAPSRKFWCRAPAAGNGNTFGYWASTDLSGTTTNKSDVTANLALGTALNAAVLSMGYATYGSQIGIVNYGGQAGRTAAKPPGSATTGSGVPVAKLFQTNTQHSLGASVSILVTAPGLCGRVVFGHNGYTNGTLKESGVWFEAFYTDTNWQITYTPGYGDSNNNYNHPKVRIDTGVPIQFNAGAVFTRLRLDWDGGAGLLTAFINEAPVAQIPNAQMPTDAAYVQGVVIADYNLNTGTQTNVVAPRYQGGSADAVVGPAVLVDFMEFVGYYPTGRGGW